MPSTPETAVVLTLIGAVSQKEKPDDVTMF